MTGRLTLALAGVAAVFAAPTLAQNRTPNPGRMVLRASDLPLGFAAAAGQTGPHTNRDVIREKGKAFAPKLLRWGRITGYRAVYTQRDVSNGSLPGVVEFGADASLYRTARGAHAALTDQGPGCKKDEAVVPLAGHRPFGADTLICTHAESVSRGHVLRVFRVQWRTDRATGSVGVVMADGAATVMTAWTAAQAQNRHMTAELRRS
jgi:hypothetical protein